MNCLRQLISVVKRSLNPQYEVTRKSHEERSGQKFMPVLLLRNAYYELERITFTNKIAQAPKFTSLPQNSGFN
jgi:hypothetical protein